MLSMSRADDVRQSPSSMNDVRSRFVVKNKPPFHIESVSAGWVAMYGVSEAAVVGRSLKVVQGPGTDMRAVGKLMESGSRGIREQATFITYNVNGQRFLSHHATAPCSADSFAIEVRMYSMAWV